MITRKLALVGVTALAVATPALARDTRVVPIGAGSAAAAFGIGAALLGTHVPRLPIPAPGVIYLPPFTYVPPGIAPPVVYAPPPQG